MTYKIQKAALSACLSLALSWGAARAAATRPFGIEDLLHIEAVGQTLVDPTGRWLVIERSGAVADAPRFDTPYQTAILRTRLLKVDLGRPNEAQPLLSDDQQSGMIALGFSPDGQRLAIGRLKSGIWQLGVTDIASGSTRWFDVAPDYSPYHQSIAWLSGSKLILLAAPKGQLPWYLRFDGAAETDLPRRWDDTRAGHPSVTLVGSGHFLDLTARPVPDSLVLVDTLDDRLTSLATGLFTDLNPAPDGKHVAVVETASPIHPRPGQRLTVDTDIERRRLLVFDLAGHSWRPCADCDVNMTSLTWSTSSTLAFFARAQGQEWPTGRLWSADPVQRSVRAIPTPGLTPIVRGVAGGWQAIGTGWSGADALIYAYAQGTNGDHAGWYQVGGRGKALPPRFVSALPDIAIDRRRGATAIGGGEAWTIGGQGPHALLTGMDEVHADLDGRQGGIWGWKREGDHLHVVLRGRHVRDLDLSGTLLATPVVASAAQASVILRETQPNGVTRLLHARADGSMRTLLTINRRLAVTDSGRTIPVRHKTPDGRMLTSWLYLPPRTVAGIKPPLIVIPYPGDVFGNTPPASQAPDSGRLYANAQMLVGHGYAVLLPSMPILASSATKAFPFADQIMAAIDATATLDLVDTNRLGLWGHSFGGFTAATVATETDRFKAIIASSGVYDVTSMRGAFAPFTRVHPEYGLSAVAWAGWSETGQAGLHVAPWSDPGRYIANSPIFHANLIKTPMMIVAGDRDVTPVPQAEELFSALYLQDKDAELLTYWGEGHVVQSPGNIRDLYDRAFHWFDAHLRDTRSAALPHDPHEREDMSSSRACQVRTHCSSRIMVRSSE
ncbi:prolyl oligopeptidase family serine peptidase [Sphingomonas abietis]|uniref:Prolyl oligopeptidase family serine peptidase n=1 Tax=Sphingomonas abietis TaxID=3012344 RepID=A0ABY7NRY6_9SPHN|nr:prolyl oligopeptidase family serine peptidase [Sphingomonas abietis]